MSVTEYWLVVCLVMLVAGTVKGVAGFGLPTIAITMLVQFFPPHHALGLIVLPLFFGNLLQACQSGQPGWAITNFWPFLITITVTIFFVSLFASRVDERVIYALLAFGIGLFLVSQNKLPRLSITHEANSIYAGIAGVLAGIMGGLTSSWAAPTIIYLRVLGLKKEEFVRAAGWMFLFGGLPLLAGYWLGGIFTRDLLPIGIAGSVMAMLGVALGKQIRAWIPEQRFIKVVDVLLALMALNLLRKAAGF